MSASKGAVSRSIDNCKCSRHGVYEANEANEWRTATRANKIHTDVGVVDVCAFLERGTIASGRWIEYTSKNRAYEVVEGGRLTIVTCMMATRPSIAFDPLTPTVR